MLILYYLYLHHENPLYIALIQNEKLTFSVSSFPVRAIVRSRCKKFRLFVLGSLMAPSSLFDIAMLGLEDSILRPDEWYWASSRSVA